jgi:hypothetical protein
MSTPVPSSIRSRTSGNSCATIGSRTASSNLMTTSSIIVALPGTSSSTCPGKSSPSGPETGSTGHDHQDLVLHVSPISLSKQAGRHRWLTFDPMGTPTDRFEDRYGVAKRATLRHARASCLPKCRKAQQRWQSNALFPARSIGAGQTPDREFDAAAGEFAPGFDFRHVGRFRELREIGARLDPRRAALERIGLAPPSALA